MRMPFGRLVELVDEVFASNEDVKLGELSERWGEPVDRITDAIDAHKMLRGLPTYISLNKEES